MRPAPPQWRTKALRVAALRVVLVRRARHGVGSHPPFACGSTVLPRGAVAGSLAWNVHRPRASQQPQARPCRLCSVVTARGQHPCQHNSRYCFRNSWNYVPFALHTIPPPPPGRPAYAQPLSP